MKRVAIILLASWLSVNIGAAGEQEVTLELKGMTCQSCVQAIRSSLLTVPGVRQVQISLKSGKGQLKVAEQVTEEQLKSAVEKAGYSVSAIYWKK